MRSLRLFGLHRDVNDAPRAGANRLQNKQQKTGRPGNQQRGNKTVRRRTRELVKQRESGRRPKHLLQDGHSAMNGGAKAGS